MATVRMAEISIWSVIGGHLFGSRTPETYREAAPSLRRGRVSRTVVPSPAAVSIATVPPCAATAAVNRTPRFGTGPSRARTFEHERLRAHVRPTRRSRGGRGRGGTDPGRDDRQWSRHRRDVRPRRRPHTVRGSPVGTRRRHRGRHPLLRRRGTCLRGRCHHRGFG